MRNKWAFAFVYRNYAVWLGRIASRSWDKRAATDAEHDPPYPAAAASGARITSVIISCFLETTLLANDAPPAAKPFLPQPVSRSAIDFDPYVAGSPLLSAPWRRVQLRPHNARDGLGVASAGLPLHRPRTRRWQETSLGVRRLASLCAMRTATPCRALTFVSGIISLRCRCTTRRTPSTAAPWRPAGRELVGAVPCGRVSRNGTRAI